MFSFAMEMEKLRNMCGKQNENDNSWWRNQEAYAENRMKMLRWMRGNMLKGWEMSILVIPHPKIEVVQILEHEYS